MTPSQKDIPCAACIVVVDDRLLLIKRGHPPGLGLWTFPGGHVEPGESAADAAIRETFEETGLKVVISHLVGTAEVPTASGDRYLISDFAATMVVRGQVPVSGDDAAAAAFVPLGKVLELPLSDRFRAWLIEHGIVPEV